MEFSVCHRFYWTLDSSVVASYSCLPEFWITIHLYTDASQYALGFILCQVVDGKEAVVAYGGHALSDAEELYSTTEREALAVVDGINRYQL